MAKDSTAPHMVDHLGPHGFPLPLHPLRVAIGSVTHDRYIARRDAIRELGTTDEIITLDGQLLVHTDDYYIALELGIAPRLREYEGDNARDYLIKTYAAFWGYTAGQRAIAIVRTYKSCPVGRPKNSVLNKEFPDDAAPTATAERMAKEADVSASWIETAKVVVKDGANLADEVLAGTITLGKAYQKLRGKPEQQPPGAEEQPKNPKSMKKDELVNWVVDLQSSLAAALTKAEQAEERATAETDARIAAEERVRVLEAALAHRTEHPHLLESAS